MRKLALLTALAATLPATGCLGLQPVGLMAKHFDAKPAATKSADGAVVTPPADAPAGGPVLQPAPPPPSPTFLITPGEVTAANAADAVARLQKEIDGDRQALANFPNYAEVSTVRR